MKVWTQIIYLLITFLFLQTVPVYASVSERTEALKNVQEDQEKMIEMEIRQKLAELFPDMYILYDYYAVIGKYEGYQDTCEKIISEMFRYCSPYEIYYMDDGMHCIMGYGENNLVIPLDRLVTLYHRNMEAEQIALQELPLFVSDGLTKQQTENLIYDHILNNYPYADKARWDFCTSLRYQGAYYSLLDKTGICGSFSFLYRVYMENIPFNSETGLSDWSCMDPVYYPVWVNCNEEHAWISVPQTDCSVFDYDITFGKYNREKWMRRTHEWTIQQNSHKNPRVWY